MKPLLKLALTLIVICFLNLSVFGQQIENRMGASDLGAWALEQHHSIGNKLIKHLEKKAFKVVYKNDKMVSATEALAVFQITNIVFISTSPTDPTQGHDTTYTETTDEYMAAIYVNNNRLGLQWHTDGPIVSVDFNEAKQILNTSELMYLNAFKSNGVCALKQMPKTSAHVLMSLNIDLYKTSILPNTKVYKTTVLDEQLSLEEKLKRGEDAYVAFISTDPDDPTIGVDTTVITPCLIGLEDSTQTQFLYYLLQVNIPQITLQCVSASFNTAIQDKYLNRLFGYTPIKELQSLNPQLKSLLEQLVFFHVQEHAAYNTPVFEAYKRQFETAEKK